MKDFLFYMTVVNELFYPAQGLRDVAYSGIVLEEALAIGREKGGGSVSAYVYGFRADGTYEELEMFGDPLEYIT